ncbi:fimbrillin family protein [Bacteroides sp.]|uniref:fimbrillin family protein n=1 Tax=Bacteroides sp. TaxID=29523 RepID=UPI0038B2ADB5
MKSRYLLFFLLMVFIGCEDNEFESAKVTRGIRIYTDTSVTRTSFQDDNKVTHVKWNAGDCILLSSGKQKNLSYEALSIQGETTEFTAFGEELFVSEGDMVYAAYPQLNTSYDTSLPDSIVEVKRWSSFIDKESADADFLYAANKVENGKVNLQFKHLFTFVKVILPKSAVGDIPRVRLKSSGIIDYQGMLFDVKNGCVVGGNKPMKSIGFIDISGAESDDTNMYLYFAILPQPENAALSLEDNMHSEIFSRKMPEGGMKAGHMYVMDMNSDKIQLEGVRERKVLADLFQYTNGSKWTNHANWCSDAPLNEWHGIEGLANVVHLELLDNNLDGTLPESLATLMDNATLIDLRNNYLHGEIPEAVRTHLRWNELGWNIVTGQYPFALNPCDPNFTNESPRSGFDFSKGNTNLFLHDMGVTLMDGSQEKLMDIISRNKLTQILVHSRGFYDSPWNVSDRRVNLHLGYQNKGLGTIVEVGYYWGEPIGEEWKEFAAGLPAHDFVFIDEQSDDYNSNSVIPISDESGIEHNVGDIFLVNSQGELVDQFRYIFGSEGEKLEEWYCHKIDSIARVYCGTPEEHPIYSRQLYTSTDYSRDGETFILQKASTGKGIDLVFMGEAFVDKDMGDGGKYEQKMKEAMEQFFAFEPYKTFRNRFNVYGVKVVSPNAEFTSIAKHRINESDEVCVDYARKVSGLDPERSPMVSVIYNVDEGFVGRSYTVLGIDGFVAYNMGGGWTLLSTMKPVAMDLPNWMTNMWNPKMRTWHFLWKNGKYWTISGRTGAGMPMWTGAMIRLPSGGHTSCRMTATGMKWAFMKVPTITALVSIVLRRTA